MLKCLVKDQRRFARFEILQLVNFMSAATCDYTLSLILFGGGAATPENTALLLFESQRAHSHIARMHWEGRRDPADATVA